MKIIKKKIHNKESRKVMLEGINQLADVVGSTFGARGRNVVLDKEYGAPLVINDGVTIAREIFFEDNLKNIAAQLIKDAAIRTNDLAGDGTTGATILAREIVKEGWSMVEEGANPVMLRREIEKASKALEKKLRENSKKIKDKEQIIQIASISVQDPVMGKEIGEMMYKIGSTGAVTIKNSIKRGTYIEKDSGMQLEGALIGGVVENPDKWETKLDQARVLIMKDSIEDHEFESKWVPFVKQFAIANQNGQVQQVNVPVFLVIAEKLSKRVIMMMNSNKDFIKWVWFRPTTAGKNMKEIYKDVQSIIGGQIVDEEERIILNEMSIEDLGVAEVVVCGRHNCVLTVGKERLSNDEYLDRCNKVKEQIKNAEDEVEQAQIRERYANLTGGVAAIKVAAATDQDTQELKLRIEDALNATRSAMEEGVVPGGGIALLNAISCLESNTNGEKVLKKACEAPFRQILYNAGYEEEEIETLLKQFKNKNGKGINVLKNEEVDMEEAGIIDPLKVIRLSLINAVSVAGLLLTSEYSVTNEEDDMAAVKKFFTPQQ